MKIELENIGKQFAQQKSTPVIALDQVTLTIAPGEMIAVTGPSGSGKSTLLNVIAFLEKPDRGRYLIDGQDTAGLTDKEKGRIRNQRIGFVLQDYGLIPALSVLQNVELPLQIARLPGHEVRERALDALEKVGLKGREKERAGLLSGGQQQRIAIARSLVTNAELILADEPTGALDSATSLEIISLLKKINGKGVTVVVATHDPLMAAHCARNIHLVDGRIAEDTAAVRTM